MPVYGCQQTEQMFAPELLKHLKGKACFHIKKNDQKIFEQIKDALKVGYEIYKKTDWV